MMFSNWLKSGTAAGIGGCGHLIKTLSGRVPKLTMVPVETLSSSDGS